jgi:hypothetical protein
MTEGLVINYLFRLFRGLLDLNVVSCPVLVYLVSQRSCSCVIIEERISGSAMKIGGGGKRFQIRLRIIEMLLFLHQYSRCHC